MKLKSSLLLCFAAAVFVGGSGCQLFRKSKKPKENPAIAGSVEADFRRRWLERRTAELTAQGTEEAAARTQAESDFREKYPYIQEVKVKK